ncbi:hypothetical protein AMS68_005507 [Peltaster fructicola]|uniref:Rad4 beta-hairpin domain-containing protein n=1 Tax=Peltaster fructicola TaxID=286661 RepID=A0A6H0Y010_9PEZI|nr:hypothetical protein AMS68_005507 [Peltaster fructicola]
MPPFVPRKRSHTPDEETVQPAAKKRAVKAPKTKSRVKPTLFDAVDSPSTRSVSTDQAHKLLDKLGGDDDSSSEADSDDFEDVPATKRKDEDDEEMDWEDAIQEDTSLQEDTTQDVEIGDISVSLREDGSYVEPLVSAATGKKGPSKRERHIRVLTHTLHVQTLVWHNTVRNSWLNDSEVQKSLVDALTPGMTSEITRWKRSMGMLSRQELEKEKAAAARKAKSQSKKGRAKKELKGRDWSYSAEHTEVGNVDMSQGDPLYRLLKVLMGYWRQRFTILAPGLRKKGYMPLRRLREELKGWEKEPEAEYHGERISNLKAFRQLAKSCEGSRDVGNQLFVALLRGIGLDVRMVASLQPAGFGWSKLEEAHAKSTKVDDVNSKPVKQLPPPKLREILTPVQSKKVPKPEKSTRTSLRGDKSQPIKLDDSGSDLSSPPSDIEDQDEEISVIDVAPISKKKPTKKHDRDLAFPVYWAEVLSPATNRYIPVDPIVLRTIGSTAELVATFEPRGTKADRGKQVICYTIAFNADGTAKDVTIRYLKRHQLPGKTKGIRMPVERVPIHNRKGKVKKYEEYEWFSELMLYYRKPEKKRTIADDLEESTDLKPFKPSTEEKVLDKESIAWYKASAEFVLEEHLRREEAFLPGSEPVKTFTAGKGDKIKEHLVFKREDVVNCKTVESWHKEGRGLLPGQQPLKYVPIRAVTLQRKREIEDAERETGEKLKQGLYSEAQTDWIIPPPIVNGVIPRNAFGNMDVYVPTMVPAGAVHLPMKGTAKICRRLEIDHAEACTGFEFGNKRAVPVITGVVVAKENATLVRNAWKVEQAEQRRKEDVKRTATSLHWWRKMLMGMRIIDRMRAEYANTSTTEDEFNPFVRKAAKLMQEGDTAIEEQSRDTGGGFLLGDDEHVKEEHSNQELAGGFLVEEDDMAGGFVLSDDKIDSKSHASAAPVSLQSMHEVKEPMANGNDNISGGTINSDEDNRPRASLSTGMQAPARPAQKKTRSNAMNSEPARSGKTTNLKAPQRTIKKRDRVSPTKSPYFSSQEPVKVDDDDDDDDDNNNSGDSEEVVSVRRTTARTRRG